MLPRKGQGTFYGYSGKNNQEGKELHPMDLRKKFHNQKIGNIRNMGGANFNSYVDPNKLLTNMILINEGYRYIMKDVSFSVRLGHVVDGTSTKKNTEY